jgi:hypothetical protein
MTQFKFQSMLFRTSAEMHEAIAKSYLSAGGSNDDETIRKFLSELTDSELTTECEREWELAEFDDDGEKSMPGYDRAELLDAFAAQRKDYAAQSPRDLVPGWWLVAPPPRIDR